MSTYFPLDDTQKMCVCMWWTAESCTLSDINFSDLNIQRDIDRCIA